jgi:SAM-dependent methyltransferase
VTSLAARLLEHPLVYRLWQAPFHQAKLEPLRRHNDLGAARRVLDVGCGPGTNAEVFGHAEYLGFDINPEYVAFARRNRRGRFEVGDVTSWRAEHGQRFDFVLVNSILHHIDDGGVRHALASLREALAPDGYLHLLELVTPTRGLPARALARADRGQFSRSVPGWTELCEPWFEPEVVEPYVLGAFGVALWHMIYYKGKPRQSGGPERGGAPIPARPGGVQG